MRRRSLLVAVPPPFSTVLASASSTALAPVSSAALAPVESSPTLAAPSLPPLRLPPLRPPPFRLPSLPLPLSFQTPFRILYRLRARWALRSAAAVRGAGGDVRRAHRAFRLSGLRWAHLAIWRDLRRIEAHVGRVDCGAGSAGVAGDVGEIADVFSFFVDRVWTVYNRLEREVVFPWLVDGGRGARGGDDVARAVEAFGKERDRIEGAGVALRERLDRMARKGRVRAMVLGNSAVCGLEMGNIGREVGEMLEDVRNLHRTEEEVLFPYIERQFTKEQQREITFRIVDMLDKPLAKFTIVSFHEGLKTAAATRADWRAYVREVPTPVRLYLWVWRGRLWEPSPLARLDPAVTNTGAVSESGGGKGGGQKDAVKAKAEMTLKLQKQRDEAAKSGGDTGNLR